MGVAEIPSKGKIESLAEERAIALAAQEQKQNEQASTVEKLDGIVLTLIRSANDQGGLYGSVTQRDISDSLAENGFSVNTRAIRLHQAIRRIGEYPVTIQFGTDMKTDIEIQVLPDRPLEDRDEMEFDDEGNLIIVEKPAEEVVEKPAEEVAEKPAEEEDTEKKDK